MFAIHGHSHYSFLLAIGTPKKIIETAKNLGLKEVGICDYQNMHGAIEFYKEAIKNGIKPIIGVELNFVYNLDLIKKEKKTKPSIITILANSYKGYLNLMKLVSIAQTDGLLDEYATIDFKILQNHIEDISILIGGENSYFEYLGNISSIKENIYLFNKLTENFYLELVIDENIKKINEKLFNISKEIGQKYILSNVFYYPSKEDKILYDVIIAIKNNETYNEKNENNLYILEEDYINNFIEKFGFKNYKNKDLIDKINIEIPLGQVLFPSYKTEEEIENAYKKFLNLN